MPRRRRRGGGRRAVVVLPARRGPCCWAIGGSIIFAADIREARRQSTGAAAAAAADADADAADPAAASAIIVPPVDGEIGNAQSPPAAYLLPDGHDYGMVFVWDHPRGVAREDDVIAGLEWGRRRSRRRSWGDEVVLVLLLCHVVSTRGSLEVRRRRPPRWRRWGGGSVAHSGSVVPRGQPPSFGNYSCGPSLAPRGRNSTQLLLHLQS